MSCSIITRLAWFALLPLTALANPAAATAVFAVGTGLGCGYPTIQDAVDAAQAYPGDEDYIYISRSLDYTAQAITIGNQTVHLVGGFDNCQDNVPSGNTTISGAGGSQTRVMTIQSNGLVTLRNLTITGGDMASDGYGGGIYYRGNGVLEVTESVIDDNIAGYGGGIYAEGTGTAAELIIGNDVFITGNTARYSGGGIYMDGLEMTMEAPGSILAFNKALGNPAYGYGGGLRVYGGAFDAYAHVGTGGLGTLGAIYSNEAQFGGGVALHADDHSAYLYLETNNPSQPAAIRSNFAFQGGGGLYTDLTHGVDFLNGYAAAVLTNANIEDNSAPVGAAAYLSSDSDNGTWLGVQRGVPACAPSVRCNRIGGNISMDGNGQPTGGAIVVVADSGQLSIDRGLLQDNVGGPVIRADLALDVKLFDTLISGNTTQSSVLQTLGDIYYLFALRNVTIAGNAVGGPQVLALSDHITLQRSIVFQPGKDVLTGGGTHTIEDVLANEISSIAGGTRILAGDPRFIDPARADYHLRAASPAVDFAAPIVGDDRDLDGLPRDQDLPINPNLYGVRDLGAYERQTLLPLVLNQNFDTDLNLWPLATANSVTWDASQNTAGSAGSGSAHVLLSDAPQARVIAATQCIHLPGPSPYRLNGWGRSVGAAGVRDSMLLHWEYRIDGGEACNAGPPASQGDHFLTTSTAWTRPAVPAYLDVPAAEWTTTSSITVFLVVVDNAIGNQWDVNGWFDGITLEPGSDVIFANGFE